MTATLNLPVRPHSCRLCKSPVEFKVSGDVTMQPIMFYECLCSDCMAEVAGTSVHNIRPGVVYVGYDPEATLGMRLDAIDDDTFTN